MEGACYSQASSDAQISVDRRAAPTRNQCILWPGGKPGVDEGVGGGAVSKYTVHAEVVLQVAVGAWALGTLVFPETRVVRVVSPSLKAEEPFVPSELTEFQGVQLGGVESVVGVLGHQVVSPDLVGRGHQFALIDDIRGCQELCRGRGGECGAILGELVGLFLMHVTCMPFSPLQ